MAKDRLRKADGQKLYALREARWFSQRKLAQLSGVSEKTIIEIELGRQKSPRMNTLLKLAGALEVYPDALLVDLAYEAPRNGAPDVISIQPEKRPGRSSSGSSASQGWDLGSPSGIRSR